MADAADRLRLFSGRKSVDLATVLGLASGLALIGAAIAYGGSVASFFDLPSVLIVVGGTLAVTMVGFTLPELGRTASVLGKTLVHSVRDPSEAALRLLKMSDAARRNGVLTLQSAMPELRDEPFLHNGLAMVVDGTPHDEVETVMRRDLQAMLSRHHKSTNVLRRAAEVSPAMGLIGTLIGLVQMLGHMDDPSTIGPSMAVALLTTFYGAVLSNMVLSPLAAKLERNSAEELLVNQVYIMGVVSIGRQENPRRLEMLLNSILPPARRVQYFD